MGEQTTKRDFRESKEALDAALARGEVPSCALDEEGVEAQQARHARLAPSVVNLERRDEEVIFSFAEDYDRQALSEMVAVEQQCCPFFVFDIDESARRLTVGVKEKEMLPAIEAIASALVDDASPPEPASAARPSASA
jgi:hypothetical protein